MLSPLIEKLIQALRCLPGVGPKSAQRMAFQILERQREQGLALSKTLEEAIQKVAHCKRCHILCETDVCSICNNEKRNQQQLCIVESPADVIAVEQTSSYRGVYFVLMGHLSPLDGIGPNEIGIPQLINYLKKHDITEIILATNPTVEGEATAHYIANLAKEDNVTCTRIAHGVPMGGELEYLDGGTLAKALAARTLLTE